MCLFLILLFFGPRIAMLFWWLFDRMRFDVVFDGFLLPLIGFFFLPWTTFMYVLVGPGGLNGFDWVWMVLGFLFDMATYAFSGYKNKDKLSSAQSDQIAEKTAEILQEGEK